MRPVGDGHDRRREALHDGAVRVRRSRAAGPSATARARAGTGSPDGPGGCDGRISLASASALRLSRCPPTSRWPPGRESRTLARRAGRWLGTGTGAVADGDDDDEAAASGVDPCEVHPAVAPSTSTAASTTARPRGAAAVVARDGLCGVDIGDLGRGGVQRIDDRPKRQKADMWNVLTVPTRRPGPDRARPFSPGSEGCRHTFGPGGASGEGELADHVVGDLQGARRRR